MERLSAKYYNDLRNSINMNNLKKIIDEKGLSIVKVATEANISDSTLYNYIKSERIPSVATLVELSRVLNTSTDYLLGLTDNPVKTNDIEKVAKDENIEFLIQSILSLPKDKQELVSAYVKGLLNN